MAASNKGTKLDCVYSWSYAYQSKKGEDFYRAQTNCMRIQGDHESLFHAFSIMDGHHGSAAAEFTKDNLLKNVTSAFTPGLSRAAWLASLPQAMASGFLKTQKDWTAKCATGTINRDGKFSGTTATMVIVDGLTITTACIGDSRCVLDNQGLSVMDLTIDHRLDTNENERKRVEASGGVVGASYGQAGPLRAWPGGLCVSRAIGDNDAGDFVIPVPHVKQVQLAPGGGRLIIASDGVWDFISSEEAAKLCRESESEKDLEAAAQNLVTEALTIQGPRMLDDTTCVIVDIVPLRPVPSNASQMGVKKWLPRLPWLKCKCATKVKVLFEQDFAAILCER